MFKSCLSHKASGLWLDFPVLFINTETFYINSRNLERQKRVSIFPDEMVCYAAEKN